MNVYYSTNVAVVWDSGHHIAFGANTNNQTSNI